MSLPSTVLVADIGGTNTRLALAHAGRVDHDSLRRYRNEGFDGPEEVVARYLADVAPARPAAVCAAVAAPVQNGTGQMTNIDWSVNEAGLSGAIGGGRAVLLNDMQAQGHALGRIDPGALNPLIAAPAATAPRPVRLVIGIGTGFNAAAVFETAGGRLVAASEAGHASLPACDPEVAALAGHLAARQGHANIEEALSGRGLAAIDSWLNGPPEGSAGPETDRDTGAVLAAADSGEPGAAAATTLFTRLLGTVAGDLALVHLPFGGVFLIGGMARSLATPLAGPEFATAFRAKGRLASLMERFPVWLIEDDYAALTGCAALLSEDGA